MYKSHFCPSVNSEKVLRLGRIIDNNESPQEMIERVVDSLYTGDLRYTNSRKASGWFADKLGQCMDDGEVVMSTPILTNAGRYIERPLAACTVPTIDVNVKNKDLLAKEVNVLHQQGMGTGFDLNELDDPVEMLNFLNEVAVRGCSSGLEDRPVGNMAVLSVYHPRVRNFIYAKMDTKNHWKFNISIDIDGHFMQALSRGSDITLLDGTVLASDKLFEDICTAATSSGDPGVIFLDRMNARNPVPSLGRYKTTAPCAEVGLIKGETCQFGYINVAKFVRLQDGLPVVDTERLSEVAALLTRALDNALDTTRLNLAYDDSREVLEYKRKIGIGICGVADALTLMRIPYDSEEARMIMRDVLSVVNYLSKEESIRLAEQRGSCLAIEKPILNRHIHETPGLIEVLYANQYSGLIESDSWRCLARWIKDTKMLRNISTIALPPTGRSALVIDASTGIEPHFSLECVNDEVRQSIGEIHSSMDDDSASRILATSQNINPIGHIAMAAALQGFCDESISKTINMPSGSTSSQVGEVYRSAHESGMSGVTVYVDGTHALQPKQLQQ